jgi:hypothetical protein
MFNVSFKAELGAFTQSGPNPVNYEDANGSLVSGRANEVGPFGIELELQAYTAENPLGAPHASILARVSSGSRDQLQSKSRLRSACPRMRRAPNFTGCRLPK